MEEQPIHTVSEHAELEGRSRTFSRDEPRRQKRAPSKAREHVVSFDLDSLQSKKAASVDMEVSLKKPQDKPPSSWVKRWPRCALPHSHSVLLQQAVATCLDFLLISLIQS